MSRREVVLIKVAGVCTVVHRTTNSAHYVKNFLVKFDPGFKGSSPRVAFHTLSMLHFFTLMKRGNVLCLAISMQSVLCVHLKLTKLFASRSVSTKELEMNNHLLFLPLKAI